MNRFEVALWSLAQIFRRVGRLDLTFADGSSRTCGSGSPAADLVLRHAAASRRLLTGGTLGLAEAYLDQAVDTGDLRALLDPTAESTIRMVGSSARRLGRRLGDASFADGKLTVTKVATAPPPSGAVVMAPPDVTASAQAAERPEPSSMQSPGTVRWLRLVASGRRAVGGLDGKGKRGLTRARPG